MQKTSFVETDCPIARSVARVGEWWSILILRDALAGMTRFGEFQKSLKIAPNILTRRLSALVDAGFFERRRYSEKPPRYEYVLSERGRDFRPVMMALLAFGNRHFAPEGASVLIADTPTGAVAEPILVDRLTGRPLDPPEYALFPGPAANDATKARMAARAHRLSKTKERSSVEADR